MIPEVRQMLADAMTGLTWPTHQYEPDDIAELPCYVIGQPAVTVDVQLATVAVFVYAIGRRLHDEEAQTELEQAADALWLALRGPDVNISNIDPVVRVVAGQTYPAYRLTTTIGEIQC